MMSVCVHTQHMSYELSFDAENLITLTADRTSIPGLLASPFCPRSPGRPFSIKSQQQQRHNSQSHSHRHHLDTGNGIEESVVEQMKNDIQINATFVLFRKCPLLASSVGLSSGHGSETVRRQVVNWSKAIKGM